jgi:hypothetical protein
MAEVKKKSKPGAIEAHPEELAIVVHYEVGPREVAYEGLVGRRTWPTLRTCPLDPRLCARFGGTLTGPGGQHTVGWESESTQQGARREEVSGRGALHVQARFALAAGS